MKFIEALFVVGCGQDCPAAKFISLELWYRAKV
jgi:hypothetical protein